MKQKKINVQKNHYKQRIGNWGESLAADYLLQQGFTLIERNFRTTDGEIDLIVLKDHNIVFVEVKTRTDPDFGYPEEAVTEEKLDHIFKVAEAYLKSKAEAIDWRVDVISIQGRPGQDFPKIDWFQDVG